MTPSVPYASPGNPPLRPLAAPGGAAGTMPGLPLGRILILLRRHVILIALAGVIGAVAAYAYARTLPKFYTASSLIAVAGSTFAIPELQGALRADNVADPMPIVRTEMQALTSRNLVVRLVGQLQLDRLPEFNSDLRPPSVAARAKSWLQSFLPSAPATSGASDPEEGVVGAALSAIRIFQDNRSLAIDVGFVSQDPVLSAKAANTLVSDYMAIRATRQANANTGANEVLTQRIDQVRSDIAGLEGRIHDLRNANELVGLRAGSVGQQQLEDLVTAAAKATLDRGQLEANYNRAAALAGEGSSATLASVLSSPTISGLREREAAASQRIAELTSRYGSSYPGVTAAQAELGSAHAAVTQETQRIITSLGTQLRVARQHEADVQKQLDETRKAAVGSENARAELKQLQDEVAGRQKLYQTMLERVQQTTGQPSTDRTPDVYVISTAAPPGGPSGPNMKFAAGFGGIGGLAIGCLLALTRLRSVPAPDAQGEGSTMPSAGRVSEDLLRRARSGSMPDHQDMAVMNGLAGALRTLCQPARPKVILFTAATGREDAATLAAAYAKSAFARGEPTLLLDADVTRPSVLAGFPSPPQDLTAMLRGDEWPAPIARRAPCLDHYAARLPAPADHACLDGPVLMNLVAQARECFGSVILLAPPLASSVTAGVARLADVTVVMTGAAEKSVPAGEPWPGLLARVQVTR